MQNIKPQNPVTLGLCNEPDLQKALALAARRAKKSGIELPKPAPDVEQPSEESNVAEDMPAGAPTSAEVTAENLFRPTSTES